MKYNDEKKEAIKYLRYNKKKKTTMSDELKVANEQVETILAAANAEGGKGVNQAGLSLDDQNHICGFLMKKGEGKYMI